MFDELHWTLILKPQSGNCKDIPWFCIYDYPPKAPVRVCQWAESLFLWSPDTARFEMQLPLSYRKYQWLVRVALLTQSCPTLCNPMNCNLPGSSVQARILQARILGYHSLLQGIFPTKGLNSGLLHCRQILYHLSHQGSLLVMKALRTYSLNNFHI